MPKNCIFTGHRALEPEHLSRMPQLLDRAVRTLFRHGCTDFYCGGADGFDLLAAQAVLRIRQEQPTLRLHLILPYAGHLQKQRISLKAQYRPIVEQADETVSVCGSYRKNCYLLRDQAMAEIADYCICYLLRQDSGTGYTVRACLKRDVTVVNLAELFSQPPHLFEQSFLEEGENI